MPHTFKVTSTRSKRRPAAEQDDLVLKALRDGSRPLSAYELIHSMRDRATLAPATVYRSLDRLIETGAAHRIESLNAFVACSHSPHKSGAIFAICDSCGRVDEFAESKALSAISKWADSARFSLRQTIVELRGTCARCVEDRSVA